jgi:hypothetical protein
MKLRYVEQFQTRRKRRVVLGRQTIAVSLAESGTLADLLLPRAAYHLTVAETGTLSDTETGTYSRSLSETGSLADVLTGRLAYHGSLSELGSLSDSPSILRSGYHLTLTETGTLSDAPRGSAATHATLAESGTLADSLPTPGLHYHIGLTEAGLLTDAETVRAGFRLALHEVSALVDGVVDITPANPSAGSSTIPVYQPVPISMSDWLPWLQLVARQTNNTQAGHLNATTSITLAAGVTTTTLTDSRLSVTSCVLLSPTTANAAAENWWIDTQNTGSAVIHHANAGTTDRVFRVLIIG